VSTCAPDEIYNLASIATVAHPWENPVATAQVAGLAPLYFLEAIRTVDPKIHFFQASSAEMYGDITVSPQNEKTSFAPQNAYGIAKLFAHEMLGGYRTRHGLFAVSGILFNHESPRRAEDFVTRKITLSLAKIKLGLQNSFILGNLDAKRDWGFAGDYVRAMHQALQHTTPDDYVIASGTSHTIREFVEAAGRAVGMPIHWSGSGLDEVGKTDDGRTIITVAKEFYRPNGQFLPQGDTSKIQKDLGWMPELSFLDLVEMMAKTDLEYATGLPGVEV
jgi:GDPmannose 4,6-dehydratase